MGLYFTYYVCVIYLHQRWDTETRILILSKTKKKKKKKEFILLCMYVYFLYIEWTSKCCIRYIGGERNRVRETNVISFSFVWARCVLLFLFQHYSLMAKDHRVRETESKKGERTRSSYFYLASDLLRLARRVGIHSLFKYLPRSDYKKGARIYTGLSLKLTKLTCWKNPSFITSIRRIECAEKVLWILKRSRALRLR